MRARARWQQYRASTTISRPLTGGSREKRITWRMNKALSTVSPSAAQIFAWRFERRVSVGAVGARPRRSRGLDEAIDVCARERRHTTQSRWHTRRSDVCEASCERHPAFEGQVPAAHSRSASPWQRPGAPPSRRRRDAAGRTLPRGCRERRVPACCAATGRRAASYGPWRQRWCQPATRASS